MEHMRFRTLQCVGSGRIVFCVLGALCVVRAAGLSSAAAAPSASALARATLPASAARSNPNVRRNLEGGKFGISAHAVVAQCGRYASCIVLADGQAVCFGANDYGEIGSDAEFSIGSSPARPAASGIVKLPQGSKVVSMELGSYHTCAVLDDGRALCWGEGDAGKLGLDRDVDDLGRSNTPGERTADGVVKIPTNRRVLTISAGGEHTCAVLDNGQGLCWGSNWAGRLGIDSASPRKLGSSSQTGDRVADGIVKAPPGSHLVAISAGGRHSCAVLDDGRALCWGDGADGRLGTDADDDLGESALNGQRTADGIVKVPPESSVVAISAGRRHTCAVLDDGRALCFGRGSDGQLGQDNTDSMGYTTAVGSRTQDAIVQVPPGAHVASISAYREHTCLVLTDGRAMCFGESYAGELGLDNSEDYWGDSPSRPTREAIVQLPAGSKAVSISAGYEHSCAVLDDGRALCWGEAGPIGSDNGHDLGEGPDYPTADGVVALPAVDYTLAAFAARDSTCSMSASATVACWGSNAVGQLGHAAAESIGDNETPSSVSRVALPASSNATALFIGPEHSCSILDIDNAQQLACWGNHAEGRTGCAYNCLGHELGAAAGGVPLLSARAASTPLALALGEGHTCTLYNNMDDCRTRPVVCWGRNDAGQLGRGSGNASAQLDTPATAMEAQLHAGEVVTALDAGRDHTCAVYESGGLVCWGAGGSGRLGSGAEASIGLVQTPGSLPLVPLPPGRIALQVACGDEHTCVLLDGGDVLCFGSGGSGRLGYGSTDSLGLASGTTPDLLPLVQLPPNRTAVQVSAGAQHTCVVLDDATVACWGEGDDGRLGYGNTTDVGDDETPANVGVVRMPHDQLVASVSAGDKHTCATLRVGAIVCWGASPSGELGRSSNASTGGAAWLTPWSAHTIAVPALLTGSSVVQRDVLDVPAACSPSATPSATVTPSGTPSATVSPPATPSATMTASMTASPSSTSTPSVTPSMTASPSSTSTPSVTGTPTLSGTPTPSGTPSQIGTPSPSPSPTLPSSSSPPGVPGSALRASGDSSSMTAGPIAAIALVAAVGVGGAALAVRASRRHRDRKSARSVPTASGAV